MFHNLRTIENFEVTWTIKGMKDKIFTKMLKKSVDIFFVHEGLLFN